MARQKSPVTARTLIQRINRVLAKKDQKLIKVRLDSASEHVDDHRFDNMGEIIKNRQDAARAKGCYSMTTSLGLVIKENLNLEDCGRIEGVLKPHEYVVDYDPDKDNVIAQLEKLLLKNERSKDKIERLKKQYTSQGLQIPEWLATF
jgi:hypothetical protein